ncbi:MAG: hypothetical protein GF353_20525 [Candidatus Lokiarchaeota archaeon]|nr:hypothetical protein [Candidatus Lokiarchaeota archaeon]
MERIAKFFKALDQTKLSEQFADKRSKKPPDLFEFIRRTVDTIGKVIDATTVGLKDLPPFMVKIFEINRDAERAFKEGRFSDFVELKYRGTEIFYRNFYEHVFDKELENNSKMNLSDIVREVEGALGVNSGVLKKLNRWRLVRNEIVHDHLKLSRQEALKAKRFFEKLYRLFEKYVKN